MIGTSKTSKEILNDVIGDKPFFDKSGGGITITGGEPTQQFDFLLDVLREFKSAAIHTAIETCGFFDKSKIGNLVGLVDLFLFDLKHPDDLRHKKITGLSNRSILENFRAIHEIVGSNRIIPRIPLIPEMTVNLADIKKTMAFLSEDCKYKGAVHLMPYNKLSKTKYEKIGREEDYLDFGSISEEELQEIVCCIESFSFKAVINR